MTDVELKNLKKKLNKGLNRIIKKDIILENKLKMLKKKNKTLKRKLR